MRAWVQIDGRKHQKVERKRRRRKKEEQNSYVREHRHMIKTNINEKEQTYTRRKQGNKSRKTERTNEINIDKKQEGKTEGRRRNEDRKKKDRRQKDRKKEVRNKKRGEGDVLLTKWVAMVPFEAKKQTDLSLRTRCVVLKQSQKPEGSFPRTLALPSGNWLHKIISFGHDTGRRGSV